MQCDMKLTFECRRYCGHYEATLKGPKHFTDSSIVGIGDSVERAVSMLLSEACERFPMLRDHSVDEYYG